MPAFLTPVRIRMLAVVVIVGFGGTGIALAMRGDPPRKRVTVSTPTSAGVTTTAPASTTTTTATTTTTPPPTTTAPTTSPAPAPAPPPATAAPTTVVVPAPASAAVGNLSGRTIAIDPGHDGGNYAHTSEINRPVFIGTQSRACDTTGTATNDGYTEATYNLDVALRLRDILQAAGANVVMTRTTNDGWGPCIDERAAIGNRASADAAISIHADGGPAGGRGFHVLVPALVAGYTDDIYSASHALGLDVRDAFLATGMPTSTYYATDGLAERSDLGGLNLSNVPKVFIETGNMRNSTDAGLLESADFRQREAQALAAALDRFL
jgi:N-acetylmuramoyl-L-alanine amidase